MAEIDRSSCILPELPECIQADCLYWSETLRCCTRLTLRMIEAERAAWRKQRKAEMAGGQG